MINYYVNLLKKLINVFFLILGRFFRQFFIFIYHNIKICALFLEYEF